MININLIAERRSRKIREMTILRISTLSVICLTIVLVLTNIAAWLLGLTTKSDLSSINVRLQEQQPRYKQWEQIQNEIAAKQPVVSLLEQVQKSEGAWMTVLGDLSQITPDGVVVDGLGTAASDKEVLVRITGHAQDEKAVAAFMLAFSQQTRWAGNPELKNCTSEIKTDNRGIVLQQPSVHFELTVPIRGLVGGEL